MSKVSPIRSNRLPVVGVAMTFMLVSGVLCDISRPCLAQSRSASNIPSTLNVNGSPLLSSLLDRVGDFAKFQPKAVLRKAVKLPDANGKNDLIIEAGEELNVDGLDNAICDNCSIEVRNGNLKISQAKIKGKGKIILKPGRNQKAILTVDSSSDIEADAIEIHEGAFAVFTGGDTKSIKVNKFLNRGLTLFYEGNVDGTGNFDNYGQLILANPKASRNKKDYKNAGFKAMNKHSVLPDGREVNGVITGFGVIHGDVTNDGIIILNDPEFRPVFMPISRNSNSINALDFFVTSSQPTGVITVTGNLGNSTGQVVEYINASNYGHLDVGGTLTINGAKVTVNTTTSPGFPATGETFNMIIADSINGANGFTTKIHNTTVYTHTWPAVTCDVTAKCYNLIK